jgi:hypothetical protein
MACSSPSWLAMSGLLQFIPDFGRSSRIWKNEESEVDIFQ